MTDETKKTTEAVASPKLTAEYCRNAKTRLIFSPSGVEEVEFIARHLMDLGFKYYNAEYPKQLANAVKGCIYLDNDKTIMVVDNKRTDGLACTPDNFFQALESYGHAEAGVRLTPEDCTTRRLIFYPRDYGESLQSLRALVALGAKPSDEAAGFWPLVARAAQNGLMVCDGRITAGPASADLPQAHICTAADFGLLAPDTAQPDNRALLSAFNEMSARMAQVVSRLAVLENEILPSPIEKPRPKLPGHG